MARPRVVVVGGNAADRDQLAADLRASRFDAAPEPWPYAGAVAPALIVVMGDGIVEWVSGIRAEPLFVEVPILAMVGSATSETLRAVLAAGATDILRQPVPVELLAVRCRNLLREWQREPIATLASAISPARYETERKSGSIDSREFLERLIDSTVDAIVAADVEGRIILFNQGAERLFGFRARDVLRKPVWELYEADGARRVMRMLRSPSYGGIGRLEPTRREIRSASGEVVPVSMTASIIYEGDREVATVGVLTDLRDRVRMEQSLLDAQQKLQLSEKHALVAELAGAAAHELNQPLTSIIAYTQLIQRQSAGGAPHMRAIGIILSEAERMANIVKKIGRLTTYETTDYIGSAKMIDLQRATDELRSQRPMFEPDEIEARFAVDARRTGELAVVSLEELRSDRDHVPSLADIGDLSDRSEKP